MADADDIVNNALTGETDEPSRYVDWLGKKADLGTVGQIRFGFYIHNTDEEMLKQNAEEAGITIDDAFWKTISSDSAWLEENAATVARKFGLYIQGEGHGEDGAYVSSAWISEKLPFEKQVAVAKQILALDGEMPSTTDGTYWRFFPGSEPELYRDVSELGRRLLDVTVEFRGAEALTEWLKLNIVENAEDVDDPATFVQHFVPRLKGNLNVDFHVIKPHFPDVVPNFFYRQNVDGLILFRYQSASEMRDTLRQMKYNEGSDLFPKTYCYKVPNPQSDVLAREFLEQAGAGAETMELITKTNAPIYFYLPVDEFNNYLRLVYPQVKLRESADPDDPEMFLRYLKSNWVLLSHIQNHHFYFKDEAGRVAVADYSMHNQRDPASADDGLLLLDKANPIQKRNWRGDPHYVFSVHSEITGRDSYVAADAKEFADLWPKLEPLGFTLNLEESSAPAADPDDVESFLKSYNPFTYVVNWVDNHDEYFYTKPIKSIERALKFAEESSLWNKSKSVWVEQMRDGFRIKTYILNRDYGVQDAYISGTADPTTVSESEDVDSPDGYLDKVTGWIDTFPNAGMTADADREHQFWKKYRFGDFNYWVYLHIRTPLWLMVVRNDHVSGTERFNLHFSFIDRDKQQLVTIFKAVDHLLTKAQTRARPDNVQVVDAEIHDLERANYRDRQMKNNGKRKLAEDVDDPDNPEAFVKSYRETYYTLWFGKFGNGSYAGTYGSLTSAVAEAKARKLLQTWRSVWIIPEAIPDAPDGVIAGSEPVGIVYDVVKGYRLAKPRRVAESVDEPEANPETYLNQIHDVQDITHDIQKYGMFVNRIEHWGKWVILSGGAYWATMHGDDETLLKADFFREQLEKFMGELGITQFHIKTGQTGPNNEHVWFQIGIPKSQLTPHSWEAFKRNTTGWPSEPHSTWLPENEVDPDDPSVNIERHTAALDLPAIMARLGFKSVVYKHLNREHWEKVIGSRVWRVEVNAAAPQATVTSRAAFGTPQNWIEPTEDTIPVNELEDVLGFFDKPAAAPDEEVDESVEATDPDDPEQNVERFAQHVEKTEQTAQWKLDSVISRAEDDFVLQVERRGINNAEAADQLVGEIAHKWGEDFHYANGSEEYDWLVSALNNKAGEMFPGDWQDYPVQESEFVSDKMDWTEFFAPLIEYNILSQQAADRYAISQNLESNEKLYYLFIEADEASQYANDADYNACVDKILRIIRVTNMRYNSAIKGFMRDVPLDEAQADPRILNLIKATTAHFGHEFKSGDCGNFAIALVRFLTENGIPASYLVEYGSHYEMFDHVTVLVNDVAYDGEGVYNKKQGQGYDEWKKEDYDIEYTEFPNDDNSVDAICKYTDPDAVFAHGSDADKTLEFMRTLPFSTVTEDIDDPSPEFIHAAFNVPTILKRLNYERSSTEEAWFKVFRGWPEKLDYMIEVKRRGFGGEQNEGDIIYDITLYNDPGNPDPTFKWAPIAHRYQRNNKQIERVLKILEDRIKTGKLRGIVDDPDPGHEDLDEALDEPVPDPAPDPDDPADVLKAHEHGLLEGELKRLAFEAVFAQGITHLYGRPIIDYWTKQYQAADGSQHALYLYFMSGNKPALRANNWNAVAKAWYQRGKEAPTDALGKSEAHFCAIIRDLDDAMQRSAADSLSPEQEHERVEAILKHHRAWYDQILVNWDKQGITGRIGPGEPA